MQESKRQLKMHEYQDIPLSTEFQSVIRNNEQMTTEMRDSLTEGRLSEVLNIEYKVPIYKKELQSAISAKIGY